MTRWCRCLLLASMLLGAAQAQDKPRVSWYLADFPPSSIQTGPLRGQGYLDRMLREVIFPALQEFDHVIVPAPPARMLVDVEAKPDVCAPAVSRTPAREATLRFGPALFRFLPVGLVLRQDELPRVAAWRRPDGMLAFGRWLHDQRPRLGVVGTRAHGPTLDVLLAAHDRKLALHSNQASSSLLQMLALGRSVDAVLAYAFELPYFESLNPEHRQRLVWLPLQEQPASALAYPICGRSPLGEAVIRGLAQALADPARRDRVQALFEVWLGAQEKRQLQALRRRQARPEDFWQE